MLQQKKLHLLSGAASANALNKDAEAAFTLKGMPSARVPVDPDANLTLPIDIGIGNIK